MSTEFLSVPHLPVPHFVETGRSNPISAQARMPTSSYAQALDHLVIACVDLVMQCGDLILLAKRTQHPRKSWWVIGGRMTAGENPIQAAQRKAIEEANLANLESSRFQYIGVYSTCFARRAQPPVENGAHTLNLTYRLQLTQAEKDQIHLTTTEYDPAAQWITLDAVPALLQDDPLDLALLQIIADLKTLPSC